MATLVDTGGTDRSAVARARRRADVVIVRLQGAARGRLPHRTLVRRATRLAGWGVDVVWARDARRAGDVAIVDPDGNGRHTVVATGLGTRSSGPALAVLAGRDGVRALRLGTVARHAGVQTTRWRRPPVAAPAVALADGWWELVDEPATSDAAPDAATVSSLERALQPADLLDVALGDVDGDGSPEVVAAFRRPHRETEVGRWLTGLRLVDRQGRSAHVGVYRAGDLGQRWVAGSVLRPVGSLAACDGALAVGLTTLDRPRDVIAVSAWRWGGFGFVTLPQLAGPARPACSDVDGDGQLDPVAVERTTP